MGDAATRDKDLFDAEVRKVGLISGFGAGFVALTTRDVGAGVGFVGALGTGLTDDDLLDVTDGDRLGAIEDTDDFDFTLVAETVRARKAVEDFDGVMPGGLDTGAGSFVGFTTMEVVLGRTIGLVAKLVPGLVTDALVPGRTVVIGLAALTTALGATSLPTLVDALVVLPLVAVELVLPGLALAAAAADRNDAVDLTARGVAEARPLDAVDLTEARDGWCRNVWFDGWERKAGVDF